MVTNSSFVLFLIFSSFKSEKSILCRPENGEVENVFGFDFSVFAFYKIDFSKLNPRTNRSSQQSNKDGQVGKHND
jgi:hypothetical protein